MNAVRVTGLGRTVRGADGAPCAIFRDVDLLLTPGRVLGLTGPEDSGVGAILRVLGGLERATAGDVEFLRRPDRPPLPDDPALRRRLMPHAGAIAPWFAEGLAPVVRAWSRMTVRRVAPAALDPGRVAARARLGADPDAALRRESAARLRAAVALCAAGGARVVLCDAPRAAAPAERAALAGVLREAATDGAAVLIATQDERLLAAVADEVLIFFDGVETARGSPDETIPAAAAAERGGR